MRAKEIRHRIRARELVLKLAVLAAFLLCLPTTASLARAAPEAEVAVYYFHGTLRCETCLLIEALAEGTLQPHCWPGWGSWGG